MPGVELYDEDQSIRVMMSAHIAPEFIQETIDCLFKGDNKNRLISAARLSTWCQLTELGKHPWTKDSKYNFIADPKLLDETVALMLQFRNTEILRVLAIGEFSEEQINALTQIAHSEKHSGVNQNIIWLFDNELLPEQITALFQLDNWYADSALPIILRDSDFGSGKEYSDNVAEIIQAYNSLTHTCKQRKFSKIFTPASVCCEGYVMCFLDSLIKGYDVSLMESNTQDPQLVVELYKWRCKEFYDAEDALAGFQIYAKAVMQNGLVNVVEAVDVMKAYRLFKEGCEREKLEFPDSIYNYFQPTLINHIARLYLDRRLNVFDIGHYLVEADLEAIESSQHIAGSASQFITVPDKSFKRFLFDFDSKFSMYLDEVQYNRLVGLVKHIKVLQNYPYKPDGEHMIKVVACPVIDYEPERVRDPRMQANIGFPREEFGGKSIAGSVCLQKPTDLLPIIKIYI
ncbi:MAG: hypothetical protein RSC43_00475 [Clostridia bacterium]